MARNLFPQDPAVYVSSGATGAPVTTVKSLLVTVYVDAACTVPADLTDLDGQPISGSRVLVSNSVLPEFYGPDGAETLWARAAGSQVFRVQANLLALVDEIGAGSGGPGSVGPQGPAGVDGADGESAYQIAVDNGFTGTQAQWLASLVGATGAKGDRGDVGPTGAPGAAGAAGDSAYAVAVAEGFAGTKAQWLASLVGATGAKGDRGDVGPTGAASTVPGPTGAKGDPGTAATVAVGTVTTGAAGAAAAATNSGTSSAAVLDFTLPRGDTGATGPKGDTGNTGSPGRGFTPRGAWATGTVYAVDDVVTTAGSTYLCTSAHTAGASFPGVGAQWTLWAAKGADGAAGTSAGTVTMYQGAYDSAKAYQTNAVVVYSNRPWLAPSAIAAGDPAPGATGSVWAVLDGASGLGYRGAYSAAAVYTPGDVVRGTDSRLWLMVNGAYVVGNAPTDASTVYWRPFVPGSFLLPVGGSHGQMLIKNSATDGDAAWGNPLADVLDARLNGYAAWTFPPVLGPTTVTTALTTDVVYVAEFVPVADASVTQWVMKLQTGAPVTTAVEIAIYRGSDGVQVGYNGSANAAVNGVASGDVTVTFPSAVPLAAGGFYYAVIRVAGSTMPQFWQVTAGAINSWGRSPSSANTSMNPLRFRYSTIAAGVLAKPLPANLSTISGGVMTLSSTGVLIGLK